MKTATQTRTTAEEMAARLIGEIDQIEKTLDLIQANGCGKFTELSEAYEMVLSLRSKARKLY